LDVVWELGTKKGKVANCCFGIPKFERLMAIPLPKELKNGDDIGLALAIPACAPPNHPIAPVGFQVDRGIDCRKFAIVALFAEAAAAPLATDAAILEFASFKIFKRDPTATIRPCFRMTYLLNQAEHQLPCQLAP